MFYKKILWCFLLVGSLLAMFGTRVPAAGKGQVVEATQIPEPMQPGSEVLFVDSSHYKILEGGTPDKKTRENKIDDTDDWEMEKGIVIKQEYPMPKKGVKVTYADDGYINRILYHGKDYEGPDHVEINHVDVRKTMAGCTASLILLFGGKG